MLSDLSIPETQQIERDRGCAVTTNAFVSGMQQYEISVHKRAKYCYIGGGRGPPLPRQKTSFPQNPRPTPGRFLTNNGQKNNSHRSLLFFNKNANTRPDLFPT